MKPLEPIKILIVDDEHTLCATLAEVLEDEGYKTEMAFDGEEGIKKLEAERFDVVFSDLRMPKVDGMKVLEKTQELYPEAFFIVMTAYGSMDTTINAMKLGAYDYVVKPLIFDDIILKLKHLVAFKQLRLENRTLMGDITEQFALDNILGQGTEMKAIYSLVQKVAPTQNTILISGETGVGKEKLAKAIHYQSKQREKRFIMVRCGSYGEERLDQGLFGEEGIFNRKEEGTLFLDEVSALSEGLQLKILNLFLEKKLDKQGLRLIVSTTKDLEKEVEKGHFREDLLYRVNVIEIKVPPLRARKKDIPFLVKYFVRIISEELGAKIMYVTDQAREVLMHYPWKGNIRELQSVLDRAILLAPPTTQYLDVHDFPSELSSMAARSMTHNFKEAMRLYEYKHIQWVLERNRFDKKKAATELGLSLSSLYRKIEELHVPSQIQ